MIDSTKQDEFLIYDGLLALTNLASVGNSVRERIMREKGCHGERDTDTNKMLLYITNYTHC